LFFSVRLNLVANFIFQSLSEFCQRYIPQRFSNTFESTIPKLAKVRLLFYSDFDSVNELKVRCFICVWVKSVA